jgi:hypothetical protein
VALFDALALNGCAPTANTESWRSSCVLAHDGHFSSVPLRTSNSKA